MLGCNLWTGILSEGSGNTLNHYIQKQKIGADRNGPLASTNFNWGRLDIAKSKNKLNWVKLKNKQHNSKVLFCP